jgi:hypothetical protein
VALTEFSVVLKAREFVRKANVGVIPVPLEPYLAAARGTVREMADMAADEAGTCFPMADGSFRICINANDSVERRRFTVCHEIGHIVLALKADHKAEAWTAARPLAERLCEPAAESVPVSLASIDALSRQFEASVTATGSRYADSVATPCAFVLSHRGKVVYASRSKALKDANAFIQPRIDLPAVSVSARVRAGGDPPRGQIDADIWFSNWERGGVLLEEARFLALRDQVLTLLWFENEEVPPLKRPARRWDRDSEERHMGDEEDGDGLKELDGNLRWPGKRRRK